MRGERILAVDDEPGVAGLVREVLEENGYRVETVHSVEPALEKIQNFPFDLLLTDMRLPGRSGLDLLRQARAVLPDLPVVIFTGHAS
ncbi:MAG: response regulator, partial [Acidobacteriota bacterium]